MNDDRSASTRGVHFRLTVWSDSRDAGIAIESVTKDADRLSDVIPPDTVIVYGALITKGGITTFTAAWPDRPVYSDKNVLDAKLGMLVRQDKTQTIAWVMGTFPPPDFEGFDKDDPELNPTPGHQERKEP